MGEVVWLAVFMVASISCNALLDLSAVHQVEGEWMGSTTLPCTYMPSEGFTQQILTWSMERDHSISTIFRRDESGDHILLARFRDRVSVPKRSPGDASLHITNLEIPDSGHYTCQVIWRSKNNSLIKKDVTTTVKVIKVPATKPTIRAGALGLTVPAGARTSLTCVAHGSPPISYRWFRAVPGGTALPLSSQAELTWDSLRPSDAGTYYCEAENRVGAGAVQRSDAVELVVRGSPVTQPPTPGTSRHTGPPLTSEGSEAPRVLGDLPTATLSARNDVISERPPAATGPPRAALSPHLYALAAAIGGVAIGGLLAALLRRRRAKAEPIYEVAFHSTADVTRLDTDAEVPVQSLKEKINLEAETSYEIVTTKDNNYDNVCKGKNPEYETLLTSMESEYEVQNF
ncbi:V-set and immunoglobulin domain-containing protein 4-like isoform X1 [Cygnus atratus]|uniref:V-set and immunoglobulin domain-containing protein 4-like isoform X1 n=1 Tax=Cygnus atratus TaxID=8868 RepID=UPI0021B733C1|nr:V-set and immunoglobulin domain-containing protein 4-like isoform X1 [Cygnus atratus]